MGFWDQFDEEGDREVEDGEAGEPDPDDDAEEDRVLAEAIAAAEAVGDDDWYAEDQREAYLAVARAALSSKLEKAERREQAAAELRRQERAREREAERERERQEVREFRAAKKPEKGRVQEVPMVAAAAPSSREPEDRRSEREVAAEERAARVRLANAQAAEIEAKAELMRAQARAAPASQVQIAAPAEAVTRAAQATRSWRPSKPRLPSPREPVARHLPSPVLRGAADRQPIAPTPTRVEAVPEPPTAATTDPVTGADLARLRADRRLSQRELAALMGVGHGMVAKAELLPTKPLGEGMAAAFTRVVAPPALPGGATE